MKVTLRAGGQALEPSAGSAVLASVPAGKWTNLADAPDSPVGAQNFAGVEQKKSDGTRILTQVRLRAWVGTDGRIKHIEAIGPQVLRNGKLMSERFKPYVLKTREGALITDPMQATNRARELIVNKGITTLSPGQWQYQQQQQEKRAAGVDKTRKRMANVGPTQVKVPGIEHAKNANEPNRFVGPPPPPRTVQRSRWDYSWDTESRDPGLSVSGMLVPNIVFELGPKGKQGQNGNLGSVTVQPFTGFFPVSGGMENFYTRSRNHATRRTTLHPAGFYPNDLNWKRWSDYLRDDPTRAPAWRASNWGHSSTTETRNWFQVYVNASNMLTPTVATVNSRVIGVREEVRGGGIYTQQDLTNGIDNSQMLLVPYSWGQFHNKIGAGGVPLKKLSGSVGFQGEVGIYLLQTSRPIFAPAKPHIDWHIVNGQVTTDRAAFLDQFKRARDRSTLRLLSESVVPEWDDRSASVFIQVPASTRAPTAEWSKVLQKAVFEVKGKRYVEVSAMAGLLQKLGAEDKAFKEFRFVSAQSLLLFNGHRVRMLQDPRQPDKKIRVFEAHAWLDTGARVVIGSPGLFLPDGRNVGVKQK